MVNKVLLPEFEVQKTKCVSPMTRASQCRGQSIAGLEADAELWILNGWWQLSFTRRTYFHEQSIL